MDWSVEWPIRLELLKTIIVFVQEEHRDTVLLAIAQEFAYQLGKSTDVSSGLQRRRSGSGGLQ